MTHQLNEATINSILAVLGSHPWNEVQQLMETIRFELRTLGKTPPLPVKEMEAKENGKQAAS